MVAYGIPARYPPVLMDVRGPVGVLCSGGLDSAVLLIEMARAAGRAVPLFVRAGHPWEAAERASLERFLAAVGEPAVAPVRELSVPMTDVYGDHWSVTGDTPGWDAPDETVEIRGRNLILLVKAFVLAALEGWPTLAVGSLAGNPFPDATPALAKASARSRHLLQSPQWRPSSSGRLQESVKCSGSARPRRMTSSL